MRLSPKNQLAKAIKIAAEAHHGQFDKGGRPYILHAIAVMNGVASEEDDELSAAAVLHDVVEDCGLTCKYFLDIGFSERTVDTVDRLTKKVGQTEHDYILGILESYDACKIKISDLNENMNVRRLKKIKEKDLQRVQKYHNMSSQIKSMILWYETQDESNFHTNKQYKAQRNKYIQEILNVHKGN